MKKKGSLVVQHQSILNTSVRDFLHPTIFFFYTALTSFSDSLCVGELQGIDGIKERRACIPYARARKST